MSKTDNTVLKDMIIIMLLYGIIAQIVCLIIPGDHLRMTAGLWIGVAAGVFMVIHWMRRYFMENRKHRDTCRNLTR